MATFVANCYMWISCKFNYKYLTALLPVLLLYEITASMQPAAAREKKIDKPLTSIHDTIPPLRDSIRNDTLPGVRTIRPPGDSSAAHREDSAQLVKIDTFNVRISKDTLSGPVEYGAADSMVLEVHTKKIYLYKDAYANYEDIKLKAADIELDQPSQMITATLRRDSLGNKTGVPSFEQGEQAFTSDTMLYNIKTLKGITKNTFTQEGEMFIQGNIVKRIDERTYFIRNGRFTTCNYDQPHFAFRTKKIKLITNNLAVSGFTQPEFEGVPFPIGLPWGIYPLKQGRRTGLLPPQFTVNDQQGLGLEGLGYYKVLNDYVDVTLRSNIYSYGGWAVFVTPAYRKRYRYNGMFNFSLIKTKIAFKGDPDYSSTKNFSVTWNHSVDSKARPGTNFSANVNFATSSYNKYLYSNPGRYFNNQLNSSISYSKRWEGKPYYLSINANHNQNTNLKLVNLSLPDVAFTVNTVYPFQKKDFVGGKKWYENLGMGLNSNLRTRISFYDTAFSFKQLVDTFQWGAQHSIPIQLSLPPLGFLQISPSISYETRWYASQFIRTWNPATKKVDTTIRKGFFQGHQASVGISFSTAIYGTLNFKGSKGVKAIRHVIRPNVGISYRPDLAKNDSYRIQVDTLGRRFLFNKYDGTIFGGYSPGKSGGMSFGIDNFLEMKVKNKKDTSADAEPRKVKLIDGFGVNSSYNFLADSFKLAPFSFYARTNLFEKINITGSASVSPYQEDSSGRPINKYAWQGGKFSIGKFTGGFISVSTSLQGRKKDTGKEQELKAQQETENPYQQPASLDEQLRELQYIQSNPGEFADFNIPWSLNLSYSLNLYRTFKSDYSGYKTSLTQSVNFNGDINLTPKWKFIMSGTFNVDELKIPFLQTSISRDMHCWQLNINIVPIGPTRSFNITISPKSSLLQDLKVNRSRYFYNF